jgi:trehalose 6-phosphate synthase/phosphatase
VPGACDAPGVKSLSTGHLRRVDHLVHPSSYVETPSSSRLLIVANRLPVTVRAEEGGGLSLVDSAGGVATGLRAAYQATGGLWIGWPGEIPRGSAAERQRLDRNLAERSIVPVHLTTHEVKQYYENFANGVIWPLCHYMLERIPLDAKGWDVYRQVNRKFADATVAVYRPGDLIWVHDYQLLLVPSMLREQLPEARIGFFLHIPFPSAEIFRTLPWRNTLLEGLLGADVVGFHTGSYARHFLTALRHLLAVPTEANRAHYEGREVRIEALPMGIDVSSFETLAGNAEVQEEAARVVAESGGHRILLGVDRLDYTKGIPRRMLAFERLLERRPDLRERVRLIQVAVPTRSGVEHYQVFRRSLDEMIGRINAAYGTLTAMPVHYLCRLLSPEQLVALYRAADVMLVTPLRDGMNLVAKEFIASRTDEGGVLVLSEFAGAASELGEAVIVNPYDIDGIASAMETALEMSDGERRTRMRALRGRVRQLDVQQWVEAFVRPLREPARPRQLTPGSELQQMVDRILASERIALLLDYDGTLVPIVSGPSLATPDAGLLAQLGELASSPHLDVHLVSGRARETLDAWFGPLGVNLWAEHGLWRREAGSADWRLALDVPREWMERVRPLVLEATRLTPGSLVEEKTASFAWHYRMADPEVGEQRGRQLLEAVRAAIGDTPIEILHGTRMIEFRPTGPSKGLAVAHLLAADPQPLIVAFGDDRTDEDMFAALADAGISVHVGPGASRARYRLRDWRAVRQLLRDLLARGRTADAEVSRCR